MGTVLILVLLLAALVGVSSFALGRASEEVGNARTMEYVELDGVCVRYRVSGEGPPVLLVHGWLSSSRIWNRLAERLEQSFTVYSLDLKGFGDSDKPLSRYGIRRGSHLLYAFCAHFELSRVGVVGHGIGGDMAVKLTADHPDLVGRLVLVSTPAREDQVDLPTPLWLATLPLIGPLFFALVRSVRLWRRLGMRPFVLEKASLEERVVEDAAKPTSAAFRKTHEAIGREVSDGRLLRQSRRVRVPVLLLAGEEDQIVDPRSVESWIENIPHTEVRFIEECGHLPMIERPDELCESIIGFLAELPEEPEIPEEILFSVNGAETPPEQEEAAPEAPPEEPQVEPEEADREQMLGLPEDLFEWPEEKKPERRRDDPEEKPDGDN